MMLTSHRWGHLLGICSDSPWNPAFELSLIHLHQTVLWKATPQPCRRHVRHNFRLFLHVQDTNRIPDGCRRDVLWTLNQCMEPLLLPAGVDTNRLCSLQGLSQHVNADAHPRLARSPHQQVIHELPITVGVPSASDLGRDPLGVSLGPILQTSICCIRIDEFWTRVFQRQRRRRRVQVFFVIGHVLWQDEIVVDEVSGNQSVPLLAAHCDGEPLCLLIGVQ
mmetsp:Transcript_42474/g.76742  ORF Transcript_42474/g.76742 Transcript_42474/m.76742 type:complete len:221 (-) Transcript_42474:536-1198(-)